jgi:phage baseplate assembly protein W
MPRLGILLPIRRGNIGYFAQGNDILTQAKSNLINLILTKKGERVMTPEFGCDIHSLIFDPITDDSLANIRGSIESATKIWLPYINIVDVKVTKQEDFNKLSVVITFSVINLPNITELVNLEF